MDEKEFYNIISKVIHYNEITEDGIDYTLCNPLIEDIINLDHKVCIYFIVEGILKREGGYITDIGFYHLDKKKLKEVLRVI